MERKRFFCKGIRTHRQQQTAQAPKNVAQNRSRRLLKQSGVAREEGVVERAQCRGPTVFSFRRAPSREKELEEKLSRLEAKVARKDQIIAEVTEEYVTLKKNLGKPE